MPILIVINRDLILTNSPVPRYASPAYTKDLEQGYMLIKAFVLLQMTELYAQV